MAVDDIIFIYLMVVLAASSFCAIFYYCTVETFAKIVFFPLVILIVGIKECVRLIKE